MNNFFGEVVLVPFPFSDQSSIKKQPTVIVSSHGNNASRPDRTIMSITSQVQTPSNHGRPARKN